MLKSSPDLANFISFKSNLFEKNYSSMEIEEEKEENKKNILFEKHLDEKEMKSNIKQGKMYQGKIYFEKGILDTAIIKSNLFDKDIAIEGEKKFK